MKFTPYGAQRKALELSDGKAGFAYFMEQGLGKTATSYADFMRAVNNGAVSRMVVFCPNSFKGGWRDDAEKFEFPVEPLICTPDNASNIRYAMKKGFTRAPVLMVNYESARTETAQALVRDFGAAGVGTFGVCDESIQLKDPSSAQTKAILEMGKDMQITRALSGKPITQGPHDLWAQMRFIKQLNGRMFYPFKSAFCKMGGFKMKQVIGAQNEDILAELIEPHIFRATKAEWTDLPPKIYMPPFEYVMTPEMKSLYRSMEEDFILWLSEDENVAVDAAITKYIKLAQIQCGFIIDEDGKVRQLVELSKNPRMNALKDILSAQTGKVTIPYRHKVVFEQLMEALAEYKPSYIRGNMTTEETTEQKRIFNTEKSSRVMLLQTKAAKYGHTLLGLPEREDHCSTQVFYENTYSLDDRSQIEDRSHRYGQLGESMTYIDIVGTPLDRDAIKALQRKESVFQAVFSRIRRQR